MNVILKQLWKKLHLINSRIVILLAWATKETSHTDPDPLCNLYINLYLIYLLTVGILMTKV